MLPLLKNSLRRTDDAGDLCNNQSESGLTREIFPDGSSTPTQHKPWDPPYTWAREMGTNCPFGIVSPVL